MTRLSRFSDVTSASNSQALFLFFSPSFSSLYPFSLPSSFIVSPLLVSLFLCLLQNVFAVIVEEFGERDQN